MKTVKINEKEYSCEPVLFKYHRHYVEFVVVIYDYLYLDKDFNFKYDELDVKASFMSCCGEYGVNYKKTVVKAYFKR